MTNTLYSVLDRASVYYRDNVAIIDGERSVTYGELGRWANRVANGMLELGVEREEAVGLLMPNCMDYIATQQGLWKAGAAVVQMQAKASVDSFIDFLTSSGATSLIYHDEFDGAIDRIRRECPSVHRVIRLASGSSSAAAPSGVLAYAELFDDQPDHAPDVDVQPDDLGYIMFTSGSTGVPKGVRHTHRSWGQNAIVAGQEIADIQPGEVFAHGAPLTHFTQVFVQPTFMKGGTAVILPGLDVDMIFDAIEQHGVTALALVPTVVYMMLAHPRRDSVDLSSLRSIVYAGSPMAPERLREAIEVFGPVFVQAYAGTEPGFMTILRKEDHRVDTEEDVRRLASAGRPMFHVEVSIQDLQDQPVPTGTKGEICSRQAGSMDGYLDASANQEAMRDGWVHSGDIGYLDEDGYLFIVDRLKDMVVTGGFNVFPRQVEDVLMAHPEVAQCAVIGVPDEKWGEAVKAVVVRSEGSEVSEDELKALVKERKGGVWAPKTVDFVDALPTNASGKLDKRSLKEPYWAGRDRRVH